MLVALNKYFLTLHLIHEANHPRSGALKINKKTPVFKYYQSHLHPVETLERNEGVSKVSN